MRWEGKGYSARSRCSLLLMVTEREQGCEKFRCWPSLRAAHENPIEVNLVETSAK